MKFTFEQLTDRTKAEPKWLESIGIYWPENEKTSESGIEYFLDLETINSAGLYIEVKDYFNDWRTMLYNPTKGQVLCLVESLDIKLKV